MVVDTSSNDCRAYVVCKKRHAFFKRVYMFTIRTHWDLIVGTLQLGVYILNAKHFGLFYTKPKFFWMLPAEQRCFGELYITSPSEQEE